MIAPDAQRRLEILGFWRRHGWAATCEAFKRSRRTLYLWRAKLRAEGGNVAALEQALIARYGTLGRVPTPFLLRSDNGLVFTSRSYTALVRSYGLRQEFITPHTPQQNGMVERVIRTLKEQCAHRHRFETLQHASRVIGDGISFYNHRRPHQALGMKTPAATFALAA